MYILSRSGNTTIRGEGQSKEQQMLIVTTTEKIEGATHNIIYGENTQAVVNVFQQCKIKNDVQKRQWENNLLSRQTVSRGRPLSSFHQQEVHSSICKNDKNTYIKKALVFGLENG